VAVRKRAVVPSRALWVRGVSTRSCMSGLLTVHIPLQCTVHASEDMQAWIVAVYKFMNIHECAHIHAKENLKVQQSWNGPGSPTPQGCSLCFYACGHQYLHIPFKGLVQWQGALIFIQVVVLAYSGCVPWERPDVLPSLLSLPWKRYEFRMCS
jgi:hypothetical protein